MDIKDLSIVTRESSKAEDISYTIFPGADKQLKENEIIIKSEGCDKTFKISIEEINVHCITLR